MSNTTELYSRKLHPRFSRELNFDPHPKGRDFISDVGHFDHNRVRFLNSSVDTVRQLFSGYCKSEWIQRLDRALEDQFSTIVLIGDSFKVGAAGKKSGYRYRLQNNELGLILFFGSYYAKVEDHGAHLKIECSPHWLSSRSPLSAYLKLEQYAAFLLGHVQATGCAVHLACDVQGWEPPKDFENRLVTRSKRRIGFPGLSAVELEGGNVCQIYGDRESFLFGSAGGCQFSVYEKRAEALHRDKLDAWEAVWRRQVDEDFQPLYDPEKPVWRLELRFHHSVINQFQFLGAEETSKESNPLAKYHEVSKHINKLWRYGLGIFRLDYSKTYIDSFWQLLVQDVQFTEHDDDLTLKRVYKTPARGSERNIGMALGNLVSLYYRSSLGPRELLHYLQQSDVWHEFEAYFRNRGVQPIQWLEKAIAIRRLCA